MKQTHKLLLIAALFTAGAVSVQAEEDVITKTFAMKPGGKLVMNVDRGSIHITTSDSEKVEVRIKRELKDASAAEAKQAADYQAGLDAIDKALSPHLHKELKRENALTRPGAADKEAFKAFQVYCQRWGFPALPAPPQAVAMLLVEESEHGAAHALRLARSISTIHRATNVADACDDLLVRALVRCICNEEKGKR